MTIEERLRQLETMVATLRRDVQSPRKFKIGDKVLIPGEVIEVDAIEQNPELPYKVRFGEGEDLDAQWFSEDYLLQPPKAP